MLFQDTNFIIRENNFAYSDVLDKIGHIKLCVCKNVRLVMGSKGRDSRKRTRGPVLDSNNPNKSSTELRDKLPSL